MNETLRIEDIAAMTGLSTRTIRNYLSLGLLDGEKIDGVWQFTVEQFATFLEQDMVKQSVLAKNNALLYDFLLQPQKAAPSVCAVIDLPAVDEAAQRERLLWQVNANHLTLRYHYGNGMIRAIVSGAVADVAALLRALSEA